MRTERKKRMKRKKSKDSIIILIKSVFCLALRSTCTTVAFGEGRLRFDNARKKVFFLGIVLNLHYRCLWRR